MKYHDHANYTDYNGYVPDFKERIKYYSVGIAGLAFTGWIFFNHPIAVAALALLV